MKPKLCFLSFFLFPVLFSCTERYLADIDSNQQLLVIDGFLSNVPGTQYINLSTTLPFDTSGIPARVRNAGVFVQDNTDSIFKFREYSPGRYLPENPAFAGMVKKTYTLTVITPNGYRYVSKPEPMLPAFPPSRISGGYRTEETLEKNHWGNVIKTVTDICEIYFDFSPVAEDFPRYRFTSSHIIEYTIGKEKITAMGPIFYIFYCWITKDDKTLRFINEKYPTKPGEIRNQTVTTMSADRIIKVPDMDPVNLGYSTEIVEATEYNRIVRMKQYRLNSDSYAWYKGIESQSEASGKMFDPMTTQLYGNMTCSTDPQEMVLGFFEVSSVAAQTYAISRKGKGTPVIIKTVPDIAPPTQGFSVDLPPPFWIY